MDFKPDPARPLRWGTMIPLIGGSALGCEKATGSLPLFHLSYAAFANNESHLEKHWPSVPMFRLDKEHNKQMLANILRGGDIDFVNSVCPCAGLSMLNTSVKGPSGRGSDAQQNEWMTRSAEFVLENIRPKVLWGENAPGLFMSLGEAMVPRLRALGASFGYSFSMVKTNTQLHGLPQQRMRTFYFFWRSPTAPNLNYVKKEAQHLHEYIKNIPKWAAYQDVPVVEGSITGRFKPYQYVLLREGLNHAQFVKKHAHGAAVTISKYLEKNNLLDDCITWLKAHYPDAKWSLNQRGSSRTFIKYLQHMKDKLGRGLGYWDDSPKFMGDHFTAVITKNVSFAAHPTEDRFFNIRELLHLMGMPHDFVVENPQRNWNHICQNVPVNTAADWAREVVKFCRGELEMTPWAFIKQDNCSQRIVEKAGCDIKTEIRVEIKDEVVDQQTELLSSLYQTVKEELKLEDIKQEIKEEPGVDTKDVLHQAIKQTFSSNFSSFVGNFRHDEALIMSPPKKIKTDEIKIDPENEPKVKMETFEKDEIHPPVPVVPPTFYKCGVCFKSEFDSKLKLSQHFLTCAPVSSPSLEVRPDLAFGCHRCRYIGDTRPQIIDHWIRFCGRSDFFAKHNPKPLLSVEA